MDLRLQKIIDSQNEAVHGKEDRIRGSQAFEQLTRRIVAGIEPINPEMVRLAREFRGFTKSAFARMLRVDTATVEAWENGLLDPAFHIEAIATATEMVVPFFTQQDQLYGCFIHEHDNQCDCGRKATRLCDAIVTENGETCDMPLCGKCATRSGVLDYCPAHQNRGGLKARQRLK